MSFKTNDVQQLTLFDSFLNLTPREKKALENSWAKIFAEEIFPKIDERPFEVLYSEKASRPNTPVNVILGACIIKELFDYSDDEIVEGLMLDLRLQYALHTTSFKEQPLSDKTLSRFRCRCYKYEQEHGVDLYKNAICDYNKEIAKMMGLDGRIRRMDSMMINSNMRMLARSELIYSCIARLVRYISEHCPQLLSDELKHYADPNDFNAVLYHERSTTLEQKMERFLKDAEKLYEITATGFKDIPEYDLFIRFFSEQTLVENGKRRWFTKEDKLGKSTNLLNPTDPEATFRRKAGKTYQGYVANLEEVVGKNGSAVIDYRYEQNIYADTNFLKERIEELPRQEQETSMIVDGGYYSEENAQKADEKNIQVIPTALTAKKGRSNLDEFILNEEKNEITRCPAGHAPKSCCYKQSNDEFKISFDRELCENCPHKDQCHPKLLKKTARILITKKSLVRKDLEKKMKEEGYELYRRIRNGIETVPSNLRRNYHLEKLPRGIQRGKFFFGGKVAAMNFRKLFTFRKGLTNYATNPLLA